VPFLASFEGFLLLKVSWRKRCGNERVFEPLSRNRAWVLANNVNEMKKESIGTKKHKAGERDKILYGSSAVQNQILSNWIMLLNSLH